MKKYVYLPRPKKIHLKSRRQLNILQMFTYVYRYMCIYVKNMPDFSFGDVRHPGKFVTTLVKILIIVKARTYQAIYYLLDMFYLY